MKPEPRNYAIIHAAYISTGHLSKNFVQLWVKEEVTNPIPRLNGAQWEKGILIW